jgi:hypothetical protein
MIISYLNFKHFYEPGYFVCIYKVIPIPLFAFQIRSMGYKKIHWLSKAIR